MIWNLGVLKDVYTKLMQVFAINVTLLDNLAMISFKAEYPNAELIIA